MWRQGTMIDATLVAAPTSTKNRKGNRDPEMSSTRPLLRSVQPVQHSYKWLDTLFGWLLCSPYTVSRLRGNSAPSSPPGTTRHRFALRGRQRQWHFGMKAHIGTVTLNGLVHAVFGTAAKVPDVAVTDAPLHGDEKGSTPLARTLQKSPIMGRKECFHVEEKKV